MTACHALRQSQNSNFEFCGFEMPLKSCPGNLVYGREIYPDPGARKQGECSFFIFNFSFSSESNIIYDAHKIGSK